MPHKWKHHNDSAETSIERFVDRYLNHDGLSFDFDAGKEEHKYQIAVADEDDNRLVGGKERDYLWGLAGHDKIVGKDESDLLYGDQDEDVLVGVDGEDRLDGGSDHDHLYGGDDADNLLGRDGDDYLSEGAGHSNIEGGEGDDTLVGGQGPDAFVVDPTSGNDVIKDFTAGPGMFDHIAFRDLQWEDLTIKQVDEGTRVSWDGGSVLLKGVTKSGLAQDDFMFATMPDLPPGDQAPEGPTEERAITDNGPKFGKEKLPGRRFDKVADQVLEEDGLSFGFQGDNTYQVVVGTNGNDNQTASDAWDHFFGRDGNDQFAGLGGDDILNGDAGDDELDGGEGMDRLDGGMGEDHLIGGAEADELMGMDGNDVLEEGAGHGMIEGGMGDDLITGGTGADAFIVSPDSGNDIVTDFEALVGMNGGNAEGAFDHLALRDIRPEQVTVSDEQVTRSFDGVDYTGVLVSWNTGGEEAPEGSILLAGLSRSDLRQGDFMFVEEPGFVEGISTVGSYYIFPETIV